MVALTVSKGCHCCSYFCSFQAGSGTVPKNWLATGSGNSWPMPQRLAIGAITSIPSRWAK